MTNSTESQYINDAVEVEGTSATGVYADQDYAKDQNKVLQTHRGDSADEVDPRKLVNTPTVSELRWYYRRTLGTVLVEKPVRDSFKNGFEFIEDDEGETGTPSDARAVLDEVHYANGEGGGNFIDAYMSAQIKARRDGFALIFLSIEDDADGVHVDPISNDVRVTGIPKAKVWPIDRLTNDASSEAQDQIESVYGLDKSEYEVRPTGIVVDSRVDEPTYREPLGYVVDSTPPKFVHKNRVMHYTWNTNVDHNYNTTRNIERFGPHVDTLGEWEGDSVLLSSYNLIKGLTKGNWAVMQALFRNAAHLYTVKAPQGVPDQEWQAMDKAASNITSKSSLVFPRTEYEVEQHESGNEMDPEPHYDAIFNQICAVHEMTRSVLFGTQSGTVSGSETDIKNYFNKVERLRSERFAGEILSFIERAKRIKDGRTENSYQYDGIEIDWGPLFKVDKQTRVDMWQTAAQSMTTLIGQYALTPDEARSFLSSEFVEFELGDLSEDQMDILDRIRLASSGQGPQALASEREYAEGPPNQQTVGRPEGAQQSSENSGSTPTSDSMTEQIERIVQLHENGKLTDDEFELMKDDIIGGD